MATIGDGKGFRGFYTYDGLTIQPMKFYVCDLYSHAFMNLERSKRLMKWD
ncbi:hypothetical protein SR187_9460 [Streptococcus ruminantium]|uniref:Uncharacterized protein n=1 Tax=Streptococcus ruminantium TaxID=1917441 RepID=A0A2Z5U5M5_9STRE|nr:hypothetical protein SR187_9460 [Streptococcus ruminantium]